MKSKPNEYYNNKAEKHIKFWKTKRENKTAFALKSTFYFSIPFTIIMGTWDYFDDTFSMSKLFFMFVFTSLFYFLLTYFYTYKVNEKNYQKYKKEGF